MQSILLPLQLVSIKQSISNLWLEPIMLLDNLFSTFKDENQPAIITAWQPRVITIVLDTQSELIITGATQAQCEKFVLLADSAARVNRCRLGLEENYSRVINRCCKHFSDLITALKKVYGEFPKGEESVQFYTALVIEGKLSENLIELLQSPQSKLNEKPLEYAEVPSADENQRVLCWAISGDDFSSKPPCLRCQHLYRAWTLHKCPADEGS